MGFLDDYGIGSDDIQEPTFERKLPAAGTHLFEVGDAVVKKGTKNKPTDVNFLITYQLFDADGDPTGSAEEWFLMKENGQVTDRVKDKLGWLNVRAKSLGFSGIEDPEFSADNCIGIKGRLEVVHNKSGDRTFANVKNVKADADTSDDDSNEFAVTAAAPKASAAKREAKASGNETAELWGQ